MIHSFIHAGELTVLCLLELTIKYVRIVARALTSTTAKTLQDEIERQRAEAMELFSEKDFDSLLSYFTPDATLMFPGSDNIQGKDGNVLMLLVQP